MISFLTHPIVLLTIGGAVGTNARYWLGVWIASHRWTEHFPLATFVINVSGSLLLGLFVLPFHNRLPHWWILLGVGFCGGYTTFSTFTLETVDLFRRHHQPGLALLNVVGSVVIGCLVTWLALVGMESIYPKGPHEPPVMEVEDP
ncbi:MAG: fluoride efflux transporter CrcB [Gemmataceae bacterium]|nr:fluoride efflux transporter CrcB [Gemmataceae bacterium]